VQEHLSQHTGAGWALKEHSAAAYVAKETVDLCPQSTLMLIDARRSS
jgi:hypothetical protein